MNRAILATLTATVLTGCAGLHSVGCYIQFEDAPRSFALNFSTQRDARWRCPDQASEVRPGIPSWMDCGPDQTAKAATP